MSLTAYLDDMDVNEGEEVMCVHNISSPNFTMGKSYFTQKKWLVDLGFWVMGVVNDKGIWCIPSARFRKAI